MGRALLVLNSQAMRSKAMHWITLAKDGSRLTFQGPQRTIPQNSRLWAMLTDVATQKDHCGRRYDAADWKVIFLHALGRETRFAPALDGRGFVPLGQSSSELSVEQMGELLSLIDAWGAENGVVFHEPLNSAEQRAGESA